MYDQNAFGFSCENIQGWAVPDHEVYHRVVDEIHSFNFEARFCTFSIAILSFYTQVTILQKRTPGMGELVVYID